MGLAGSGRTEEQQRVAMRHPTAGREFAELALVERGLGAPVEPLEVAHERELRDLRGHLDAPMVAAGDRKSVVEGKSVSVSVDFGGGSVIEKKNKKQKT